MRINDPTPSKDSDELGEVGGSEEGSTGAEAGAHDQTTVQVRRAMAGDGASVEWVIERFGPALTEQAGYRMPRVLRGLYSIEDVVQDVWIAVLPRLGALESRGAGMTRVLLRYFSTALVNRINELARRHARGEPLDRSQGDSSRLSRLIEEVTGLRSRADRNEAAELLHATLNEMDPLDREILILRGIEQHSNQEAAALVGQSPDAVSHRYTRALAKLRLRLPNTLLDDV